MHARTIPGVTLVATLIAGLVTFGVAAGATPEEDLIAAASSGVAGKLGPWLASVHQEYQKQLQQALVPLEQPGNSGARRDDRRRPVRQ
jgi:hypothetical protein